MQYEYSNEPEEDDDDSLTAERNYVNELILQRSRNRHPGFSDDRHDDENEDDDDDDDVRKMRTSTAPTLSKLYVHSWV